MAQNNGIFSTGDFQVLDSGSSHGLAYTIEFCQDEQNCITVYPKEAMNTRQVIQHSILTAQE